MVLEAARLAPSGANRQQLVAIAVDDRELKVEIRKRCEEADRKWWRLAPLWFRQWAKEVGISLEKGFLTSAPYLLCIFGDSRAPYWLESVWLAVGYITLAATEQGLGCLTYTPGKMHFLNPLLRVPGRFKPVAIVPLGFPTAIRSNRGMCRKPLEQIAYLNRYGAAVFTGEARWPDVHIERSSLHLSTREK